MGTDHWIAPEVIETLVNPNKTYNIPADVWSFGIFAVELANREPPHFRDREPNSVYQKILHAPIAALGKPWSAKFNEFVKLILNKDA